MQSLLPVGSVEGGRFLFFVPYVNGVTVAVFHFVVSVDFFSASCISGFSQPFGSGVKVEVGAAPLPAEVQQGLDVPKGHSPMLPEPQPPRSPPDLSAGTMNCHGHCLTSYVSFIHRRIPQCTFTLMLTHRSERWSHSESEVKRCVTQTTEIFDLDLPPSFSRR